MRLVLWNCHQALHKKYKDLMSLHPDVALIPESAHPGTQKLRAELVKTEINQFAWAGKNANKGLGLFAYNEYQIQTESIQADDQKICIRANITNSEFEIKLVGLWTQGQGYVEEAHRALDIHKEELKQGNVILAGDLNSNTIWDKKRTLNHSALVEKLKTELSLTSAYHKFYNEHQGSESQGTFFFQYDKDRPYHIDYVFIPEKWIPRIKSFEIGKFKDWSHLSDHCPIVLELDL